MEGVLGAKSECYLLAAQDGVLKTNVYRAKIFHEDVSPQCRMCEMEESTAHILAKCPIHFNLYKARHDKVLYLNREGDARVG